MTGKSKSAKYYAKNPEARKKKNAYNKEYHSTPARKKYRRELAAARRKKGIMGKGGPDLHHTKSGKLIKRSVSKNRGDKKNIKRRK